MRKPAVPRAMRAGFLRDLREARDCDCRWPRPHGSRPRCGRCFACHLDARAEVGSAIVH
jgi:hypothetical protein